MANVFEARGEIVSSVSRAPAKGRSALMTREQRPHRRQWVLCLTALFVVSVPFIKSLGMRITRMTDGHAILRMPRSPEKADRTA